MVADAQGFITPPSDNDWIARAQINEYDMKCKVGKTSTTIQITVKAAAERNGEATESLRQPLTFFIASLRGNDVVQKETFEKNIDFGMREKTAKEDFTLSIELPFENDTAADRNVMFGFQLNQAQLQYMRNLRDARTVATVPAPATR